MKSFEKITINRPLGLIFIFLVSGILTYYFGSSNLIGTALVVVPLFLFGIFILERDFLYIGLIFFLIGVLGCTYYYEPKFSREGLFEVRIVEVKDDFILGKLNGRLVEVRNQSGKKIEYGEKVYGIGKFKREINLERGRVGYVFLKDIIKAEKDIIYKIKNIPKVYYERLNKYFGKAESGILNVVLWGDKENLTYGQRDFLADLGVIHLICISGFHIALLFSTIYKKLSFKLALLICSIYVLLVGASPSSIRALIMITILKSAKKLFKTYDPLSSISFAATIILILMPYSLFNMGFLLSFGGTLGILLFYKKFLEIFYMLPPKVNEYFSLGLSAQVFIYPILVIVFGKFTINFLISTFLITPIIVLLLQMLLLSLFLGERLIFILVIPLKIILVIFRGILVFLDKIAFASNYLNPTFALAYMIMGMCIYMSYKGFKKFRIGVYLVIPLLILDMHVLGTKIRVIEDKWNKGVIVEHAFIKIALVNNNSDYFKREVMKKEFVSEVIHLKGDTEFHLKNGDLISIEKNFNRITLMSEKSDYDIIDLIQKKSAYIL